MATVRGSKHPVPRFVIMPKDVFISHSSIDRAFARDVCTQLEQQGISCWIAPRDILPGQVFAKAILDAIDSARVLVLILSASANESPFVESEVNRAFSQRKSIMALRVEDVKPTGALELYLARHHWNASVQ
jgi:hypothetical protein